MPNINVAVVGHSHIKRLKLLIDANPMLLSELEDAITVDKVETIFLGAGGVKIKHLFHSHPERLPPSKLSFHEDFGEILMSRPDCIIFSLGDNDINCATSAEEISSRLIALATMIQRRHGVRHIIFSQILPRHGEQFDDYNIKAFDINNLLARESKLQKGIFFQHLGFAFPSESRRGRKKFTPFLATKKFYRTDGIHLNNEGYLLLLSKIKNSLIQEATFLA